MMLTRTIYVLIFISFTIQLASQWCATSSPSTIPENYHNYDILRSEVGDRNDIDTINVVFHIARNSNNNPAVRIETLDKILEETNEVYKEAGLYFRFCGVPTYINQENFIELDMADITEIMSEYKQPDVINIYLPKTLYARFPNGLTGEICGVASFPDDERSTKSIIISANCLSEAHVLSHELGHFYELYHTHETTFGRELVRREGCAETGDLFCDTPADPLLNNSNHSNCVYLSRNTDREGNRYEPDLSNIMSYSDAECKSALSFGQIQKIKSIHRTKNNYISTDCSLADFTPFLNFRLTDIYSGTTIPVPVEIENIGTTFQGMVEISIVLEDIKSGKKLRVYDGVVSFEDNNNFVYTELDVTFDNLHNSTNQKMVVVLDPNNVYRELDKNNNRISLPFRFKDGKAQEDIIFPNPAANEVTFNLNSLLKTGDLSIKYYDVNGVEIMETFHQKRLSNFTHTQDISHLPSGIFQAVVFINNEYENSYRFIKK